MTAADLIAAIACLDPADCPALLAAIAARMVAVKPAPAPVSAPAGLVDAATLAAALDLHKSQVMTLARQGKIPSVKVGRYVRFNVAEVEQALRNG